MRCLVLGVLSLSLALVGGLRPAAAAPAEVEVGAVRAVVARAGTRLMAEPVRGFVRPRDVLPYGTRVQVLEKRVPWMRVRAMSGRGLEGWLLVQEAVDPYALSGEGRLGRTGAGNELATVRTVTTQEQAAVARGWSETQEKVHRQSRAEIQSAYAALDQLEAIKPAPASVEAFVVGGGLGRYTPPAAAGR